MNVEWKKNKAIQSILDKKENLQEEIDKLLSSEEIWNERLSDDIMMKLLKNKWKWKH